MTASRRIAFRVLGQTRRSDTPFQALLDAEFESSGLLDPRDRNLATHLVTGVIRHRLKIDWIIGRFSRISIEKIDPDVLDALRLGVYQLLFLDRVPDQAAINESVELLKKNRPKKVVGFVNGILRSVQRNRQSLSYPDPVQQPVQGLSIIHSHPPLLVERWIDRYGIQKTEELLKCNNQPAPRTIRVQTNALTREELIERLKEEGASARPTSFSPDGLVITETRGPIYQLPSYGEGLWVAQDEAAQVVSLLVHVYDGARILDLCAGRGVKFGHLVQRGSGAASLTAVEIDARKAASLSDITGKWERDEVQVIHQDAVQFADSWKGQLFDAVLADVPCSGTGTIRRHPDIKWKDFEELLPRLVQAQRSILDAAARLVNRNGVILYVTCSLEAEENDENVDWFLNHRKDFTLADLKRSAPSGLLPLIDESGCFRTWPPLHTMDGFFAALLKRG